MIEVCDRVEYGLDSFGKKPQTWRVTHHMRKQYYSEFLKRQAKPKTVEDIFVRKWLDQRICEERAARKAKGLPYRRRFRLLYCRPEEATHVQLVSVCGDIAPISKCKKLGVVAWTPEQIAGAKTDAVSPFWLKNDFYFAWEWEN